MGLLKGLVSFFKRYELESAAIAFAEAGEIETAREFLEEAKRERVQPEIVIEREAPSLGRTHPQVVSKR